MESADAPVSLTLTTRVVDDATRALRVQGEVDVYTAPRLAEAIREAARDGGVRRLLVLLSDVEYMDSTGLSVLIQGNALLHEAGGAFVLVGPRPRIARLFEITGLNSRLTIVATEEDGLNA
jgi:anti-sigma B factor antagonist